KVGYTQYDGLLSYAYINPRDQIRSIIAKKQDIDFSGRNWELSLNSWWLYDPSSSLPLEIAPATITFNENANMVARSFNLRKGQDEQGETIYIYDTQFKQLDMSSITQISIYPNGRLYSQAYEPKIGPKLIRLYFDERQLPLESYIVQGEIWEKLPQDSLIPYAKFVISYDEHKPGTMLIIEVPVQPGVSEDIQRFIIINDTHLLPVEYFLTKTVFFSGRLMSIEQNHNIRYYSILTLKQFGPQTVEGQNRLFNNIIGSHIRVFLEETLPRMKKNIEIIKGFLGFESNVAIIGTVDNTLAKNMLPRGITSAPDWLITLGVILVVGIILFLIGLKTKLKQLSIDNSNKNKGNGASGINETFARNAGGNAPAHHIEILNRIIDKMYGGGECDDSLLGEIFDTTYAGGFRAMVKKDDAGEVAEKLYNKDKFLQVCQAIREDMADNKLRLMNNHDLANEIFIRMVDLTEPKYVEEVLKSMGFDKSQETAWDFGLFKFKRKDHYVWHYGKQPANQKGMDIFAYIVSETVKDFKERLVNGYGVSYREGKSDLGIYMKVERPKAYRFEKKNGQRDIPAGEWTGWIEIPLEWAVENRLLKFCRGALSNNVEYTNYLRYVADTYRQSGQSRQIIPHVIMSAAVFSKLLSKELYDKKELRTIRSPYEQTPDVLDDVYFPLWLQACRKKDGTYEHPLEKIGLTFGKMQEICNGLLRDSEGGEVTALVKKVRELLQNPGFTFVSMSPEQPLDFTQLWAILKAIEETYKGVVCSYVVQDIVRKCIFPVVYPQQKKNLEEHVQRYPMRLVNPLSLLRIVFQYLIKPQTVIMPVFVILGAIVLKIFFAPLTLFAFSFLLFFPVVIILARIIKYLGGENLIKFLTEKSRGKQGQFDFAFEQVLKYLNRKNIDIAWEFAQEEGNSERMKRGMCFFASFLKPDPGWRELITAVVAMTLGYVIISFMGFLPLKMLVMLAIVLTMPVIMQKLFNAISENSKYPWEHCLSYSGYGITILYLLLAIFGIPAVQSNFVLTAIPLAIFFALAVTLVCVNFLLMPKVLTPIGQATMTSKLFDKTLRFMARNIGHINCWLEMFTSKTTKASSIWAVFTGIFATVSTIATTIALVNGSLLFAALGIVVTFGLLAFISSQLHT
ncbi:MAG: hypothetical protein COX40_05700, partial [Candidatus Omnitrophica bacterium CG23_combo_of_CG06-09_8_20_14_all_40_11]